MSSDLVGASYALSNPLKAILAGVNNVAQSNVPPRSNAEWLSLGGMTDGALAATGVGCFVPVPVDVGMVVSKVSILTGATAGATMTNQIAAIYAGTGAAPALLGQSTDTTSAAITAKTLVGWSLTSPHLVTAAEAPFGFIYALIAITAATVPTAATVSVPAGVNYQFTTSAPLFLSGTAGSALAGTAAATIASPSAKVVAPIVVLS